MNNYEALKTAVADLLSELRVTPRDLKDMSEGYSPNYPGRIVEKYTPSTCKIQISKIVAKKLFDSLDIPEEYFKEK